MIVVVDASVFVTALQATDKQNPEAIRFLAAVEADGHEIHDPTAVLVEVACAVGRAAGNQAKGTRAMEAVKELVCLRLIPLSEDLADHCARIGAQLHLRAGDALYAGLANAIDAPLVTYDKEMRTRSLTVLKAQTPKEWLAER